MAFIVYPQFLIRGTMRKRHVIVCDIVEEMYFFFLQEKSSGDGVDRSIAPTLVKETAVFVELVEVIEISLGSEPVKVTDFEIGPLKKR